MSIVVVGCFWLLVGWMMLYVVCWLLLGVVGFGWLLMVALVCCWVRFVDVGCWLLWVVVG